MDNKSIKKIIIIVILGFCIFLGSNKAVSAISIGNDRDKSLYFVQLINYSLPVAKVTSFNSEDLAEKNRSLKEQFWNIIGVDINSPASFIGKEISLLNTNVIQVNAGVVEELNPFQLSKTNVVNETIPGNTPQVIPKALDANKPVVLIYHSHTTESYTPTKNNSTDETMNVCAVGDALQIELEKKYGISTIHDKTIHDALGDINAYSKSRVTVDKYLKQYGNFKLIIDIHRDSSSNKKNDVVVTNGETIAKSMFVMCQDGPYASENLAIASRLTSIANSYTSNFFKNVYTYYHKGTLYFNQDLSNNSVLLEVGTNLNSATEAKASSKYLARVFSEYLKGK